MRYVKFTEAASANIQCCGVWVQCLGTIIGLFPEWWWSDDRKRGPRGSRPFVFGVKIWAADYYGGVHTVFQIKTKGWSLRLNRAFSNPSPDRVVGWALERCAPSKAS